MINEQIVVEKSISVCAPEDEFNLIDYKGNVQPQSKKQQVRVVLKNMQNTYYLQEKNCLNIEVEKSLFRSQS